MNVEASQEREGKRPYDRSTTCCRYAGKRLRYTEGLTIMAQQLRAENMKGRSNLWSVGTSDLIYIVVGSLLYGLFSWVSAGFKIPGPFNSFIRPGVAIPLF